MASYRTFPRGQNKGTSNIYVDTKFSGKIWGKNYIFFGLFAKDGNRTRKHSILDSYDSYIKVEKTPKRLGLNPALGVSFRLEYSSELHSCSSEFAQSKGGSDVTYLTYFYIMYHILMLFF